MRYDPGPKTLLVLALAACAGEQSPTAPGADHAVAALTSNTWSELGPHPLGTVTGVSAGVFTNSSRQSVVFAFGGIDDEGGTGWGVQRYNVATDTWRRDTAQVFVFDANGVGTIGGRLYLSGGYVGIDGGVREPSRAVWAYDPVDRRLTRKADMPRTTAEGVTGVIGDKLFVLPGVCGADRWPQPGHCEQEPIRRLYRYDPVGNKWGARKSAPHFHRSGAAGVIGGKFYVAGGFSTTRPVADLDVYDPATDTWTTRAPMPTAGRAIGTALGGKLYVVADAGSYVYDPGADKWSPIASPAWGHDAIVRVVIDGEPRLLALGGQHGANLDIANDSEVYTP